MTRNGSRLSGTKQEWIKYAALLVLAVVAFGVAGIALAGPRSPEEPAAALEAVTPTAAATPTASPTPTATATATTQRLGVQLPAEPVLLILGDSYTVSEGAARTDQGWAYLVAGALGYPTNIDGEPGTGFAWGGGAQDELGLEYEARLQTIAEDPAFVPNLLILQGGQNDSLIADPEEIKAATAQTIEAARRLWPGVQVVVLGPTAPQPFAGELRATNGAIRAGAETAKAPFVDAAEGGWFTDANSPGYDFDGGHPNAAGHAHIAEKFLEAWAVLTA
ncbi:SGNH/GDSL hydrolase family protein [Arthrobacter sp. S39]|uniref:SGNH/GDSL hydrolase family protein n=1 Tax=Arthrobacter sp. S39 TaxID=2509720 RepID=UPI001F5FD052|nr:SGNH/GDSL hydrolase family protein [Arthrobacter sp. S39]